MSTPWRVVIVLVLIGLPITALTWASLQHVTIPNPGFDASGALVFMTTAAVGIERVIEGIWGLLNTKWPWWPMSALTRAVHEFEQTTNELTESRLAQLDAALAIAVAGLTVGSDEADEANRRLQEYRAIAAQAGSRVKAVRQLGPGNERLQLLSDSTTTIAVAADRVMEKTGTIASESAALLGNAANLGTIAQDIIGSFKENPARRLVSLSLGSTMGLVVAGAFGLNLFVAAEAAPLPDQARTTNATMTLVADVQPTSQFGGANGILLTGLIIGLGSAPTHEVIRLVQEAKRNRKTPAFPDAGPDSARSTGDATPASGATPVPVSTKTQRSVTEATTEMGRAYEVAKVHQAGPASLPIAPRRGYRSRLQSTE